MPGHLSNPGNARIANSEAVGLIVDNDGSSAAFRGIFSVRPDIEVEDSGGYNYLSFVVTRVGGIGRVQTVDYRTVSGTAHAGTDFVAATGRLSFSYLTPTATVRVRIQRDSQLELPETMFLQLSNPTSGSVIANGRAEGIIIDNDAPSYRLPTLPALPPTDPNDHCEALIAQPSGTDAHCMAYACVRGRPLYYSYCPGEREVDDLRDEVRDLRVPRLPRVPNPWTLIPPVTLPTLPSPPPLGVPRLPSIPRLPSLPRPTVPPVGVPRLPPVSVPRLPTVPSPSVPRPPTVTVPRLPPTTVPTLPRLPTVTVPRIPSIPNPNPPRVPRPSPCGGGGGMTYCR